MLKYQVWSCDVCGTVISGDGYPKEWIQIELRKGGFYSAEPEVDKDCCCQACANKAVLDYYSVHRLEV